MTRAGRYALALLAGVAFGLLSIACLWASEDPDGAAYAVLATLLAFLGVMVAAVLAVAPVVARQAGGRR